MTEHNNTFVATVTYWNAEKKFGFAENGGQRVFIHLSNNVEVDGTPEDPKLTERSSTREPNWWRGSRRTESIVVKATMGPKGLKAAVWGFVPVRTWLEALQHNEKLDTFAGGHVDIGYSKHHHSRYIRESLGKLTALPRLTTDPWTLHLSYDAYDGPMHAYGESTGRKELTLSLEEAYPAKSLPYGRYALDVHIQTPGVDEWAHIVFYPAGQWIGH